MADQATDSTQASEPFNRFAIPARWGLMLGILICILFTIRHMYLVESYWPYTIMMGLTFVLTLIIYCVAGVQQRKAMGGYISFKDAFSAIFVVILISMFIDAVYSYVYMHYIDPGVMDKLKQTVLTAMEKMGAPETSIEQADIEFDERMKDADKFGPVVYTNFKFLIGYSIFGFICAAIVRKKKPEFGAA